MQASPTPLRKLGYRGSWPLELNLGAGWAGTATKSSDNEGSGKITVNMAEDLKKRISEAMKELDEEQRELDDILRFIDSIENAELEQMSGSASSARNRRNKDMAKSMIKEKEEYERKRADKEANIGRMWEKIYDLQEQERNLQAKNI